MKKVFILAAIVIVMCSGCFKEEKEISIVSVVSATQVFEMIEDSNIYIIDVREANEYATGHLKGAINIPVGSISQETMNFISFDSKIIVYCMSGARSKVASDKLVKLGYQHIYDLSGGIRSWNYEVVAD